MPSVEPVAYIASHGQCGIAAHSSMLDCGLRSFADVLLELLQIGWDLKLLASDKCRTHNLMLSKSSPQSQILNTRSRFLSIFRLM